ncbi:MAG: GNAT family N-acetyltransferase [Clostridium sp.]|nr:GNAT family N-acetyltransferase [Clostridium sp.]
MLQHHYYTIRPSIAGGLALSFIDSIAVDREYRGKGIGRRLFEKAKQIKEESCCDTIELQVNAKNKAAYEIYKHCGFTEKSIHMELK